METESNKQKIELGDLKKCGEITTLLSVGKKEFFLNCGFCDYTFLRLENFISHMCEDHMFHFIGPKKEKTDLPLDLNEENEDADFNMQSSYTVEEIDDSASNLRDFERVEIELDDTKMSDSMDVKDLFGDRFMSEESEESSDDDDLENSDDAEMPEKVLNPNDDAEIADSLKALDVENKFDKKMVLRIFKSFEKRPALWDVDVTLTKHSREKEIKSIAMEVGTPAEWDSVRKLLGKLSSRLRTEMVRKKIYESKGKAYTPIWYSDLNTFLKPRRPSGRDKPTPKPTPAAVTNIFRPPKTTLTEEQVIILAAVYKGFPSLWDETDITYRFSNRRRDATNSIHVEFNKRTGLNLTQEDVASEISKIRKICSYEKKQQIICKRQNKPYQPICKYFEHISYLEADVKPYECPVCGLLLAGSVQHKIHVAAHDGSQPFKCHVCEHGFNLLTNLTVHLRRHAQDYMYTCEVCNKQLATTTDLKSHMRYHTGEKPFVCDICGKDYRSMSHLKTHRDLHDKKLLYQCEVCSKAFFRKALVKEHMNNVHIKNRDKICKICNKGFTSSKHLRQHIQIHAEEKKYSCKICGKRFAQYAGLSGHVKSHGTTLPEISSKSVTTAAEDST
ncbi:zinc finger protein 829-like isoform X1 [Rhagoletis pomonella]|uniref:zinc finger protein 829-like isoform X1 n=1 Tax=Rhagoletis pomonella TaxID=28610 RepID=UPI0017842711|nr:zinc finger protein 829-like isoform X1 [Rhagoletis pomonella]